MRPNIELLTPDMIGWILDEAFQLLMKPGVKVQSVEARELLLAAGAQPGGDEQVVHVPERLARRALAPLSHRVAERASGMLDAFIHGLRLVPGRGKLGLFLLLTVVYWGLNGWGMQVLARGFGFEISVVEAYTVLGVLIVGVMIPAGPGMVGTFQYAVVLGLSLFVPREALDVRGQAYANVLWGAQLAQLTAFGLFFLFSKHIEIARLFRAPGEVEEELEQEEAEYLAAEAPGATARPAASDGPPGRG
jgi:hypothetical protein